MLIICIKTNVVSRQIEYIVHLVSLIIVAGRKCCTVLKRCHRVYICSCHQAKNNPRKLKPSCSKITLVLYNLHKELNHLKTQFMLENLAKAFATPVKEHLQHIIISSRGLMTWQCKKHSILSRCN